MKRKIFLLYGGKSAEHQVSMRTALAVVQALDFNKYEVTPIYITENGQWVKREALESPVKQLNDLIVQPTKKEENSITLFNNSKTNDNEEPPVIFPLLHGTNGEDGTVQGLLEVLNLPYVGNGVLASAAGMDKVIMKNIFAQAGLKQVDFVSVLRYEWEQDKEKVYQLVEEKLTYPYFVKPANLGSSVGINKCRDRNELEKAFVEAFQYDRKIIVEQGIEAREIEIGVIGNEEPKCSVVGEIVPKAEFYDYKAKYEDGDTALISGLIRADFFVTKDGEVYINEVNTMPGFTPVSMFPLLWKHSGVDYPQLIDRLIELGIERYNEKQKLRYTID